MTDARFLQAEQRYRQLKAELDAGRITGEHFERTLWDSMFEANGRWWMLGANTGRWYSSHGADDWVECNPPLAPADRGSNALHALISASLLVPTLPVYFFAYGAREAPHWALFLVLDLYLVAVVAIWGRSTARRRFAVALALVGTLVDRGFVLLKLHPTIDWSIWFPGAYASVVLFVAAWGVARRRNSMWLVGLIPTIGIVVLAVWFHASTVGIGWFLTWLVDVGVFVVGCLMCWGLDVAAGSARRTVTFPAAR